MDIETIGDGKEVPGISEISVPDPAPANRLSKIQNGVHNTHDTIDEGKYIFNSFLSGHEGFQSLGLDAVLRRILVEIFMARFEVFFEKMTMLLALAAADELDVPCYGTKKELQ